MPFFQNPFRSDFEGNWLLGDRHHVPKFVAPQNAGRGDELVLAWKHGPYNLSGNDSDGNPKNLLKISFSLHSNKNWATHSVDISDVASDVNAVTPQEIVSALNADSIFAERFTAILTNFEDGSASAKNRVGIRQNKPVTEFKFYIINGQAEEALGMNDRAGVGELPTYFSRHTLSNRFNFSDSQGFLIELDPSNNVDAAIIDNAVDAKGVSKGFDSGTVRSDWELLEGRSGLFQFTHDLGNGEVVTYSAGAKVGDLAKKTITDGSNVFEVPHTLEAGDLISPP